MDKWIQMIITIICSMLASSGFWAIIQKRIDKKDITKVMLLGLAHDRIVSLGMCYIERGDWITQDEYENLNDYLYKPYLSMHGNGTAKKIMEDVNRLKIVKNSRLEKQ